MVSPPKWFPTAPQLGARAGRIYCNIYICIGKSVWPVRRRRIYLGSLWVCDRVLRAGSDQET